jgi:hypothetical protein
MPRHRNRRGLPAQSTQAGACASSGVCRSLHTRPRPIPYGPRPTGFSLLGVLRLPVPHPAVKLGARPDVDGSSQDGPQHQNPDRREDGGQRQANTRRRKSLGHAHTLLGARPAPPCVQRNPDRRHDQHHRGHHTRHGPATDIEDLQSYPRCHQCQRCSNPRQVGSLVRETEARIGLGSNGIHRPRKPAKPIVCHIDLSNSTAVAASPCPNLRIPRPSIRIPGYSQREFSSYQGVL